MIIFVQGRLPGEVPGAFQSDSDSMNDGDGVGLELLFVDGDPVFGAVLLDGLGHRQQRLQRQQVCAEIRAKGIS